MPMPCSPEITPSSDLARRMMRATAALASLQHLVVVGVDRDVGVHVAVAGVHVQRDEHAAAQHLLVHRVAAFEDAAVHDSLEDAFQLQAHFVLPGHAHRVVLQQHEHARILERDRGQPGNNAAAGVGERRVEVLEQVFPADAGRGDERAGALDAVPQQLRRRQLLVVLVERQLALEVFVQRIEQRELVLDRQLDVDALDAVGIIAQAGSGITTSSLILKALVCLAMAAVRARSSQNFLRASGLTAMKAFAAARVGDAHHLRCGGATAFSSSPTMSPISTIFGRPDRRALVA